MAIKAEVARVGPAFDRAGLVAKFLGRAWIGATLSRWISAEVESGRPGQAMVKKVKASAARRAKRSPDPAKDATPVPNSPVTSRHLRRGAAPDRSQGSYFRANCPLQ
jgi:hypothetical protein